VNRIFISISLEHQNTGPFGIIRIIFYYSSIVDAFNNITGANIICYKLIVTVLRNPNGSTCDETFDALERITHGYPPTFTIIGPSAVSPCLTMHHLVCIRS